MNSSVAGLHRTREQTSLRMEAASESIFRQERMLNERERHQLSERKRIREKILHRGAQSLSEASATIAAGHKQLTLLTHLAGRIKAGHVALAEQHKAVDAAEIDVTSTPPMKAQIEALYQ